MSFIKHHFWNTLFIQITFVRDKLLIISICCLPTGIPVSGVEIDGAWWHCKYAPPTFIPLLFTANELDKDIQSLLQESHSTALLFCYFNNREAFNEYLKYFSGNVIVIIGPADGKGVHTDPKPFGDVPEEWKLYDSQEVRDSKDFIAIYRRNSV